MPITQGGEFIEIGAEIGVILLLLMLGLEYSADELLGNLRRSRTAGLLDMVLNAVPGAVMALVLGWGPVAALALAGITWVSSSGVIAKMLQDLGRLTNRETPVILSILVIEDLAMAFYLPILTAVLVRMDLGGGTVTVLVALAAVFVILFIALRHGPLVSRLVWSKNAEVLLLSVLGITILVAGVAAQVKASAAVGAFLVGIAISGHVAVRAERVLAPLRDLFASVFFLFFGLSTDPRDLVPVLIPAVILAVVTMANEGAHRLPRRPKGRHRGGGALAHRLRAHSAGGVLHRHRGCRRGMGHRRFARRTGDRLCADHDHRGADAGSDSRLAQVRGMDQADPGRAAHAPGVTPVPEPVEGWSLSLSKGGP